QAIWWAPGLGEHWTLTDLSAAAAGEGDPIHLSGHLASFVTTWNAQNLLATDDTGDTTAVWWSPELGTRWATTNLSAASGGARLDPATIDAFVAPWRAMHVVGLDAATGRVTAYWWAPGDGAAWHAAAVDIAPPSDTPPTVGPLHGAISPAGTISLSTQTPGQHAARIHWTPGDGAAWTLEDLTVVSM